jgi:membrane-bound ClpP family serine protease
MSLIRFSLGFLGVILFILGLLLIIFVPSGGHYYVSYIIMIIAGLILIVIFCSINKKEA